MEDTGLTAPFVFFKCIFKKQKFNILFLDGSGWKNLTLAVWDSTGWKQPDPLKHRARPAARASTALLQDKLLKHRARPRIKSPRTSLLTHGLFLAKE